MIVRNVADTIKPALASVASYVDEVVIVDTGSTDSTEQAIRSVCPQAKFIRFWPHKFGTNIRNEAFILDSPESWDEEMPGKFTGNYMLADFAAARNLSFETCTKDFILWIDSDDIVLGSERIPAILKEMDRDALNIGLLTYEYEHDDKGNVACELLRERFIRRGTATWKQPIHECLTPIINPRVFTECKIVHQRKKYKLKPEFDNRNIKVLYRWWEKNKKSPDVDPRMLFYLAMEERFIWADRAVEHFELYCKKSGWDQERAVARYLCGEILEAMGRYDEAFISYAQGSLEDPDNPDNLFGAARIYYQRNDWQKCVDMSHIGFFVAEKPDALKSALHHNPLDRTYRPHIYLSVAYLKLGRVEEALRSCNEGLKFNPDEPHLKGNKEVAERHLAHQSKATPTMTDGAFKIREDEPLDTPSSPVPSSILIVILMQMWKKNMEAGLYTRAMQLLSSVPPELELHKKVVQAKDITTKKLEGVPEADSKEAKPAIAPAKETAVFQPGKKLRIVIWTGPAWEPWSPKSLDTTGLGGSETAAICMAKELRALGHEIVAVLSQCDGMEGEYDGIPYVHFQKAVNNPHLFACDVLVVSRQPSALSTGIPHKTSYVWVHDIHLGDPSQGDLSKHLLKADHYFCLSQWHKEFFLKTYPFIHADSVIVTKNGLDLKYFENKPIKEGNRLIYSSSPDRGLARLLELFPRIRERVPDAQLDVYYGFVTWKSMAKQANDHGQLAQIEKFEQMLEAQKNAGVTYHGRVSKTELAQAFLRSKVWAYPTWFTETYCITAIEAAAAGCVPVTTALAALPETVSHGFVLQRAKPDSEEYAKTFVDRVVKLLTNEEERSKFAQGGRQYAFAHHGWDKVASKWAEHFQASLKQKSELPISLPRFGV